MNKIKVTHVLPTSVTQNKQRRGKSDSGEPKNLLEEEQL